jgi:hypothetical protein
VSGGGGGRRGDHGDPMGMLTLDGIHREDSLRQCAATAGGGLTWRRCSGVGPATWRG